MGSCGCSENFPQKHKFHETYLWHPCDFQTTVDHIWKYWFDKPKAIQIVIVQNILPKFGGGGYWLFCLAAEDSSKNIKRLKQFIEFTRRFLKSCQHTYAALSYLPLRCRFIELLVSQTVKCFTYFSSTVFSIYLKSVRGAGYMCKQWRARQKNSVNMKWP